MKINEIELSKLKELKEKSKMLKDERQKGNDRRKTLLYIKFITKYIKNSELEICLPIHYFLLLNYYTFIIKLLFFMLVLFPLLDKH